MATKTKASILFLLPLSLLLSQYLSSAQDYGTATYWGQDSASEGELLAACLTDNYEIINIAFLDTFGLGMTPTLNLSGHCGGGSSSSADNPCAVLASQIRDCQTHGVKIFLSLGGYYGNYSLASADEAKHIADYLWNTFLGGRNEGSPEGPLGDVVLDGIDLFIKHGGLKFYDVLAQRLHGYTAVEKFYLSAAPQCAIEDRYLDAAIKTGAFDNVYVLFYNSPSCQLILSDPWRFVSAWNQWANSYSAAKFYAGVYPGILPVGNLNNPVIPFLKTTPKFGGIMVSNRSDDVKADGYSGDIIYDDHTLAAPSVIMMMQST